MIEPTTIEQAIDYLVERAAHIEVNFKGGRANHLTEHCIARAMDWEKLAKFDRHEAASMIRRYELHKVRA